MKEPPFIMVQFVHIQGPLKGQIQEFPDTNIIIGRHPSCQVQFPTDFTGISRKHAELIREGNRFKLVDHSTNGTFVNGKRITEAYLKDGDVIMFTEGGPKVSFLTQVAAAPPVAAKQEPAAEAPQKPAAVPVPPAAATPSPKAPQPVMPAAAAPAPVSPPPPPSAARVQAPLFIQFGPTLRSYKELPVLIGQQADCDFVLAHPTIAGRHAEIFFSQGQYWVRDLTGGGIITVNGAPMGLQTPLKPQDILRLAPGGPAFSFLGEGRLAEYEEAAEEDAPAPKPESASTAEGKKGKSFIKDLFKK